MSATGLLSQSGQLAIVGYTLVWTVLFGLTVGLPLHPIETDLDELMPTD